MRSEIIKHQYPLLLGSIVLFVAIMLLVPRIPQDSDYHIFADNRAFFAITNFMNVISNLPFVFVGLLGLALYPRVNNTELLPAYIIFCTSVLLVGFGSAYYHHVPDNPSLTWDRLPMTVAFMSLFCAILGDSLLPRQNRMLLTGLIVAGIASILYWHISEQMGAGDLRPYALVQFLPILIIPPILVFSPPRTISSKWLWLTLAFYGLAKVLEYFDGEIYSLGMLLSGHSLKHIVAALACLCVLPAFGVLAGGNTGRHSPT